MTPVFLGFIFVFGTVIGSFLNAVIWRLRTRQSFVKGRSRCTKCGHTLAPVDLVPVASYLFLRGRCRYCRTGIDAQYFLVELAVGALFLVAATRMLARSGPLLDVGMVALLIRDWYFIAILTIVFIYDLRYMQILRSVTAPAALLAFVANLALGVPFSVLALGVLIGGGFFWVQHRISAGKWIGGGDIQLGYLMGAMLGVYGLLNAFLIAYVVGAAIGITLIVLKRANRKTRVPFGTFLAVATAAVLLYGDVIQRALFGI